MPQDLTKALLSERFEHLLKTVSSERFLQKKGLGNEIPFFICPYDPREAVEMERLQKQLVNKLSAQGITVLAINLYDLSVDLLKQEGDWEWILEEEQKLSKRELKEELQSLLDVETILTPAIRARMDAEPFDVLFLSGVGEVYPYIRSHNVLNNLQKAAKDQPTLMFFPGEYTHSLESGASLNLFGRLQDDKYYRAFNIYHFEI
jgi:hypothetical protein